MSLEFRERLVLFNLFEPSTIFYGPFQGDASFMDSFSYLCFVFVFIILSCLFIAAL